MDVDGNIADNLRTQLRKTKKLTRKSLAVNLYLASPQVQDLIEMALEGEVHIFMATGASISFHTGYLKDKGVTVLHMVAFVRDAKGAETHGVDAAIAEGLTAAA